MGLGPDPQKAKAADLDRFSWVTVTVHSGFTGVLNEDDAVMAVREACVANELFIPNQVKRERTSGIAVAVRLPADVAKQLLQEQQVVDIVSIKDGVTVDRGGASLSLQKGSTYASKQTAALADRGLQFYGFLPRDMPEHLKLNRSMWENVMEEKGLVLAKNPTFSGGSKESKNL